MPLHRSYLPALSSSSYFFLRPYFFYAVRDGCYFAKGTYKPPFVELQTDRPPKPHQGVFRRIALELVLTILHRLIIHLPRPHPSHYSRFSDANTVLSQRAPTSAMDPLWPFPQCPSPPHHTEPPPAHLQSTTNLVFLLLVLAHGRRRPKLHALWPHSRKSGLFPKMRRGIFTRPEYCPIMCHMKMKRSTSAALKNYLNRQKAHSPNPSN